MSEKQYNNDDVERGLSRYSDEGYSSSYNDDFMTCYKDMWRNAFEIHYGTERGDFWKAMLVHFIIVLIPFILFYWSVNRLLNTWNPGGFTILIFWISMIFLIVYAIASAIPTLHLVIRRIKDTGLSPWFVLLGSVGILHEHLFFLIVSLIAFVSLIVILVLPSDFKL